jgi:hypothetical protein
VVRRALVDMVADSVLLRLENGRLKLIPGASRLVQVTDDSLQLQALSAVRGYRGNRDCGLALKNISSRSIWALFNWEMRSAKQKLNQGKACGKPRPSPSRFTSARRRAVRGNDADWRQKRTGFLSGFCPFSALNDCRFYFPATISQPGDMPGNRSFVLNPNLN